jgi:hypothetical protein
MMRCSVLPYALLALGLGPSFCAGQGPKAVQVALRGVTTVAAVAGGADVVVTIKTRPPWGSEKGTQPDSSEVSLCSGPVRLCSFVESLDIRMGGKTVEVPRSAICNLVEVHWAELSVGAKRSTLTFTAGDASTSYVVKIQFDQKMVRHRTVAPGEFEEHVMEETTYYELPPLGE